MTAAATTQLPSLTCLVASAVCLCSTTGLDSAGAYAVISTVSKLSEHMAVVCTIHQPPIEIVNYFKDILLMKAGGEVVYFGHMNQLTNFFRDIGLGECAPEKNPVDFALEQLKQA